MRFRTFLPAATLIATTALGATACDAGIEDKNDASGTKPPATSGQPTATGPGTPQGTPTATPATGGPQTPPQPSGTPGRPTSVAATGGTTSPANPGGQPIVVSASGDETPVDCTGRDVRVEGSDLTMTFTGTCGTLIVSGDDNSLETGWFDRINVTGSNNLVLYGLKPDKTAPAINNTGTSNRILKK